METIQTIKRHVEHTEAIVVDLDKTLVNGRVSADIGMWYLKREIRNRNYRTAATGIVEMSKVQFLLRKLKGSDTAEARGLEMFYAALIKTGIGERAEMQDRALNYFINNTTGQVSEIVRTASKPKFLATISGSTIAHAAVWYFGLNARVSNIDLFRGGYGRFKLAGVNIIIGNGNQKLEAVEKMLGIQGMKLKNCTVIGDGRPDIPLMSSAGLSIASPHAIEEVNAIAKIQLAEIRK